jgi:hypothetical protein
MSLGGSLVEVLQIHTSTQCSVVWWVNCLPHYTRVNGSRLGVHHLTQAPGYVCPRVSLSTGTISDQEINRLSHQSWKPIKFLIKTGILLTWK